MQAAVAGRWTYQEKENLDQSQVQNLKGFFMQSLDILASFWRGVNSESSAASTLVVE